MRKQLTSEYTHFNEDGEAGTVGPRPANMRQLEWVVRAMADPDTSVHIFRDREGDWHTLLVSRFDGGSVLVAQDFYDV